jgi:hypothetical protein
MTNSAKFMKRKRIPGLFQADTTIPKWKCAAVHNQSRRF